MKTLGIITTTYNRGYCIHQVYESLKKQKSKDFMWLVVDDGSIDNTKDIIQSFINEDIVQIEYLYQENKGMTGARNTAYKYIKTEINTIIDSDDWMAEDAVDKIINFWKKNKADGIAGIIALNQSVKGDIIGTEHPNNVHTCTYTELFDKYHGKGDKKLIYRSDLTRLYPYPEFTGEKFFPASYKFRLIDLNYKMLLMNEAVCIVDYNENSMSFDKVNQYRTCAKGFSFYRNEMIRISTDKKFIIKQTLHYIAESKLARNKSYIRDSAKKSYTIACWPLGILLYLFIKNTKMKVIRI
ncbi:glycosyltransferase family 2 protein [Neobacillus sp. D3-1R]|uniref:glycosyltransferase family 2 protein n=1 Tax=Neobacillus sp. D3-1R TaxID=3445778 RepID=UPI003FA04737